MIKNMQNIQMESQTNGTEPDLTAMLAPVMDMMSQNMVQGMTSDVTASLPVSNSIEDQINAQLEQSKQDGTFPRNSSK